MMLVMMRYFHVIGLLKRNTFNISGDCSNLHFIHCFITTNMNLEALFCFNRSIILKHDCPLPKFVLLLYFFFLFILDHI